MSDKSAAYPRIQRAFDLLKIPTLPLHALKDTQWQPIICRVQLTSGAKVADTEVDLIAGENYPNLSPTVGILATHGEPDSYVGGIYGLTAGFKGGEQASDVFLLAADAEIVMENDEGEVSAWPLSSLLRIVPGAAVATTATDTTMRDATGCPNGGQPQRQFPVFRWMGTAKDKLYLRYSNDPTLAEAVDLFVEVWGVFCKGKSGDVHDSSLKLDSCRVDNASREEIHSAQAMEAKYRASIGGR